MTEKEAGKIAARMMQQSLRLVIFEKIKSGKGKRNRPVKNSDGEDLTPLAKSRGLLRMQKSNSEELRGIAIKMGKHGFILNNGVNRERTGGTVHRTKPNSTFYKRKAHPFFLKERPFIDEAVNRSAAVEFLAEKIGEIRTDAIVEKIKFAIEDGK